MSEHAERVFLGSEEDVYVFVGVEVLCAGLLDALSEEGVAEVVHGRSVRAEGGEEGPSATRVACLLPEFPLCGGQGVFAFLYAAGTDLSGYLSEPVAVLPFEDEQTFLGFGDDVDPTRIFEDVVLGMHPPVGQLHLVFACREPGAAYEIFRAEYLPAEVVVVECHSGRMSATA